MESKCPVRFLVWSMVALSFSCADKKKPSQTGGWTHFRDASTGSVAVGADEQGRVRTVEGVFATSGSTPEERAISFLEAFKADFGLSDVPGQLATEKVVPADQYGGPSVVLGQRLSGLPVFGATVIVHLDGSGAVTFVTADLAHDAALDTTVPTVSSADAKIAAVSSLGPVATPVTSGEPELTVLCPGLFSDSQSGTWLAWSVTVDGGAPATKRLVFVDAQAGKILLWEDLTMRALRREVFQVVAEPPSHDMNEIDRSGSILVIYDDTDGVERQSSIAVEEARNVAAHVRTVYDYFNDQHGWDSFDGQGGLVKVYTDWVQPADLPLRKQSQALFNSANDSYWFTRGRGSLEIVAHEFTHGVVKHTANPPYISYAGSLNEALADVFAAFIEPNTDWNIAGFHLDDPTMDLCLHPEGDTRACPAHWDNRFLADTQPCPCPRDEQGVPMGVCDEDRNRCWSLATNFGAIHENGRIISHAVYLAYQRMGAAGGGTGGGELEREVLGEIFWRVLTKYLSRAPNFKSFRDQVRRACRDLVGTLSFVGYKDCGALINAFADVGLGAYDSDNDSIDDVWDNCVQDYNPLQEDADKDWQGDICDESSPNRGKMRCPVGVWADGVEWKLPAHDWDEQGWPRGWNGIASHSDSGFTTVVCQYYKTPGTTWPWIRLTYMFLDKDVDNPSWMTSCSDLGHFYEHYDPKLKQPTHFLWGDWFVTLQAGATDEDYAPYEAIAERAVGAYWDLYLPYAKPCN